MKNQIRKFLIFTTVFSLIFTLTIGTYASNLDNSDEEETIEQEEVQEKEILDNKEDGKEEDKKEEEKENLEKEEKPKEEEKINEVDEKVENLEEVEDEEETLPDESEDLEYTVKYFIDSVEKEEMEEVLEVPEDNPIIEEVSYENKPEGYVLDEENSTDLPFEIREEENVIEVYYSEEISLLATNTGLQNPYQATTEVLPLEMDSTNDHTIAFLAWYNGPDLYLAIASQHNAPIEWIEYNGIRYESDDPNVQFDRATSDDDKLIVEGPNILGGQQTYLTEDYKNKSHWNVVNLGPQVFTSPFKLSVETELGGGHSIYGINVYVASELRVDHKYYDSPTESTTITDSAQSGELDEGFSYSVYPIYEYNDEDYELVKIEVEHNGSTEPDKGPDDLVDGRLNGTVDGDLTERSAKITFIYQRKLRGKISITKIIEDFDEMKNSEFFGIDNNLTLLEEEFEIKINGPNGYEETVMLKHGETEVFEELELGEYTVEEINIDDKFKLVGINLESFNLTRENPEKEVEVKNRVNFYEYGIKKVNENGEVLEGAEFELRSGDIVERVRTNSDGIAWFKKLLPGEYTLQEIKAPEEYKLDDREITITIDENGNISTDPELEKDESDKRLLVIENSKAPVLPETGGIGTILFTIVGIGLMVVAYFLHGRNYG